MTEGSRGEPAPSGVADDLVAVDVHLESADAAASARFVWRAPEARSLVVATVLLFAGLFMLIVASAPALLGLVGSVLVIVGLVGTQRWQHSQDLAQEDIWLQASRDGVTIAYAAGSRSWVPWTRFTDVGSTTEHLFLKFDRQRCLVLPRRCFDQGDDERLLALARRARPSALAG